MSQKRRKSAFPEHPDEQPENCGMSMRFYAACQAMNGMLSGNDSLSFDMVHHNKNELAEIAFEIADEMIKYENS